ncbi:MAG TPA: phosphatidate cytidylyltransferase [Thermoanaerobaculia bacterium]|jgi:phosphatidate cytidylyltransferase
MQRLLTAVLATPIALAAVFWLPGWWFFVFMALVIDWAAFEYLAIVRPRAPRAPLRLLLVLAPLAAYAISFALTNSTDTPVLRLHVLAGALVISIGLGTLLLFSRTPLEETIPALGILGFGIPYFALPIASVYCLRQIDPWVVFLLLAIVWLGDTAAYYVGSRIGRHKLAPVISPKKSWEGAAAGFVMAAVAAVVWTLLRLGRLDFGVLAAALATAVAAQIGDLVESMIKRGSGVKDSGSVLPGHGGLLDRMDALLFAAPVLLFALWLIQAEVLPK